MSQSVGTFPFGQPIYRLVQADRGAKRLFILGVYASAVHAWWMNPEGKQIVRALGVATEPCIFWPGEGVDQIVSRMRCRLKPGAWYRQVASSTARPVGLSMTTFSDLCG